MKLVIVESPTKAGTINHFLGKDFKVLASNGHVRDLALDGEDNLGIDIKNNFTPHYEISEGKKRVVDRLIKECQKSEEVYLATDPDREGEAISFHLAQLLDLDIETTKRIEFHEITPYGISNALENVRTIDMDLVRSQETRRIIDRIIGFKLSKLVNKKIHSKSAGRVQSVVLKLICEREREIQNFSPEEYWNINLKLAKGNSKIDASLVKINGNEPKIANEKEKNEIVQKIPSELEVTNYEEKETLHYARPCYVTSSLQIDANIRYKFSTSKTMKIAQELFEGVKTNKGITGLITYMRTDSIRIAPLFVSQARKFIEENYGKEYLGKGNTKGKSGANIQDAHEAIRPTHIELTPESLKDNLSADQYKLYSLIYYRALSSIMAPRKTLDKKISFEKDYLTFEANFSKELFDGYFKVLDEKKDKEKFYEGEIEIGSKFKVSQIEDKQNFTKPKTRYSEATMVKEMQDKGIGRPSTYAPTIENVKKTYANVEKGFLVPSSQGFLTNDKLQEFFEDFINVTYTAKMEEDLDLISKEKISKDKVLKDFYDYFVELYEKASSDMEEVDLRITDKVCPNCGKLLVRRKGKYNDFLGCSDYPRCTYVESLPVEIPKNAKKCPNCKEGFMIMKNGRYGAFLSCSLNCGHNESFKKNYRRTKK